MLNANVLDKPDVFQTKAQSSVTFLQFEYRRKISKKLLHPSFSSKCYWTLLDKFLYGRKTPPLFHENKCITDFKEKSDIFNSSFAKQCSLIDNGSTLSSLFPFITDKSLLDKDFSTKYIENVITKLDSNEAHDDNMIIILMLILFDISTCKHLDIIFKSEWKKANVVPIHKKRDKQCVSLLPIHSKVFERNIYNKMFPYFIKNNLTSENQSGFKKFQTRDFIIHEIFYSFDDYEITKLEVYIHIY